MEQSGTVSAHLDGNVLSMLKKIAADEDRSVSWLVGYAVKQLIADRVEKQQPFRDGAAKHRQVDLETWDTTTDPPVQTPPTLRSTKIKRPTSKKTTRRTHHGK
jgi:predicted transcriptional regulator